MVEDIIMECFPNSMRSYRDTKYARALPLFRAVALLLLWLLIIYYGVGMSWKSYFYFTNWGILLTNLYFFSACIGYYIHRIDKFVCVMFLIIWVFNWGVTLAFWVYLFPIGTFKDHVRATVTHSIPLILTLIDFAMNNISFIRVQFPIATITLLAYCGIFLLPYTLEVEEIYVGINFRNVMSYVILAVIFCITWGMMELGKLFKEYLDKDQDSLKDKLIV